MMKFKLLGMLLLGCSIFANAQLMEKEGKYGEIVKFTYKDKIVYPDFNLIYQIRSVMWYKAKDNSTYAEIENHFLVETPSKSLTLIVTNHHKRTFTLDKLKDYELEIKPTEYVHTTSSDEEIEIKIVKLDK